MDATPPTDPDPYDPPRSSLPRPGRSRGLSALVTVFAVFLVILSALIGFVATCFPAGLLVMNGGPGGVIGEYTPWILGILGGAGAGYVAARLMFRKRQSRGD